MGRLKLLFFIYFILLQCFSVEILFANDKKEIDKKRTTLSQSLDEFNDYRISVSVNSHINNLAVTFVKEQSFVNNSHAPYDLPVRAIFNGLTVRVNGELIKVEIKEVKSSYEFSYGNLSKVLQESGTSEIELSFYDKVIGSYTYDPSSKTLIRTHEPLLLSAFDLRQFKSKGKIYASKWRKNPITIQKAKQGVSGIDLHTHFAGALREESILRVAEVLELPYPTSLLEELKIKYNKDLVFIYQGVPHINLTRELIERNRSMKGRLSIPVDETINFKQMEDLYRFRSPLLKNKQAFAFYLKELVKDYQAMGVHYVELSMSDVVEPEWLAILHRELPQIEKETGVKLRFNIALWRHSDEAYNLKMVEKIRALKNNKYIVGVDFMGEETNSTLEFAKVLRKLDQYRKQENSTFQIRVHAGENKNHMDNIKNAIKLGATRIGHGIYGVDEETLRLAKENNVIIEFNTNSNLALQNINESEVLPIRKYLNAGVRVTIGTDGHGLYNTTPQSEIAVLKGLGITEKDLKGIRESDAKYVAMMEGANLRNYSSTKLRARGGCDVSVAIGNALNKLIKLR